MPGREPPQTHDLLGRHTPEDTDPHEVRGLEHDDRPEDGRDGERPEHDEKEDRGGPAPADPVEAEPLRETDLVVQRKEPRGRLEEMVPVEDVTRGVGLHVPGRPFLRQRPPGGTGPRAAEAAPRFVQERADERADPATLEKAHDESRRRFREEVHAEDEGSGRDRARPHDRRREQEDQREPSHDPERESRGEAQEARGNVVLALEPFLNVGGERARDRRDEEEADVTVRPLGGVFPHPRADGFRIRIVGLDDAHRMALVPAREDVLDGGAAPRAHLEHLEEVAFPAQRRARVLGGGRRRRGPAAPALRSVAVEEETPARLDAETVASEGARHA